MQTTVNLQITNTFTAVFHTEGGDIPSPKRSDLLLPQEDLKSGNYMNINYILMCLFDQIRGRDKQHADCNNGRYSLMQPYW